MDYAPGSIMDPITNRVDATVCDKFPLPEMEAINTKALIEDIYKRTPGYLWQFIAVSVRNATPVPLPAPPQAAATEISTPGPSAQSAGPSEAEPTATTDMSGEIPAFIKPDCFAETSPASTEAEGDFEFVTSKSQKRKLKASKSLANPPKKSASVAPPTASAKSACNPPPPTAAPSTEEPADSPMAEPPKERVPPLYVREKSKWDKLIPLLDAREIAFSHARSTAVGIRVQCPDSINHRRLTALLRSEKVGFHTYALQDERVLRVVIRGLPREIETAVIKEDLLAQGFPVQQVHRMYHSRSKHPFDMVLVILDLNDEGKKIYDLKSVCRLSGLKVQDPKGRGTIGQCHNCQIYGHSARNCFAESRCVKCLGNHGTIDCPRKQPTEEPPSCVLCGAKGHPANYRGCPKAPKEPRRRVKPAGRSGPAPPKPPQKFIAAPAPASNAWHKPLLRAPPPPTPTVTPAPSRAVPSGPAPAARPAPTPAAAPVAPATTQSSFSSNWRYVSIIINTIDTERLNEYVQKSKVNFEEALFEYADLLEAIKACKKTLNG